MSCSVDEQCPCHLACMRCRQVLPCCQGGPNRVQQGLESAHSTGALPAENESNETRLKHISFFLSSFLSCPSKSLAFEASKALALVVCMYLMYLKGPRTKFCHVILHTVQIDHPARRTSQRKTAIISNAATHKCTVNRTKVAAKV
jgi:hypothetical protein